MRKPVLYTIGHSTRPIDEFLELLNAHGIETVVDVRTIPRSRHNPQYDQMALRRALRAAHIGSEHMPRLGGLRHSRKDSPNTGWINPSFRGFADHMQSKGFQGGRRRLEAEARTRVTAIMCAEAFVVRCHRSLIADALTVDGWRVRHIQSRKTATLHRRTPFLKVRRGGCSTRGPRTRTRADHERDLRARAPARGALCSRSVYSTPVLDWSQDPDLTASRARWALVSVGYAIPSGAQGEGDRAPILALSGPGVDQSPLNLGRSAHGD